MATPTDCWPTPEQRSLLAAALLEGEASVRAWAAWRAAATLPLPAGTSRIFPAVYRNLQGRVEPDEWLLRCEAAYQRTRSLNLLQFEGVVPALQALSAAGVDLLLLKGAALVAAQSLDPGLRPMADVDLLVRPKDAARAITTLEGEGWVPAAPVDASRRAIVHSTPLVRPSGTPLDLHWRSLEGEDDDQAFWTAAVPGVLLGEAVRVPGPADQLLHTCVHGLRWDWDSPHHWVLDAMTLLGSSGERLDWDLLARRATQRGVALAVHDALRFVSDAFGAPVPGEVLDSLARAPTARIERWADTARRTRPDLRGPLLTFALHVAEHRSLARRGVVPRGPIGLVRAWQLAWGLPHPLALPVHAAWRGCRRLWQLGRRRVAHAIGQRREG